MRVKSVSGKGNANVYYREQHFIMGIVASGINNRRGQAFLLVIILGFSHSR